MPFGCSEGEWAQIIKLWKLAVGGKYRKLLVFVVLNCGVVWFATISCFADCPLPLWIWKVVC